MTSTQSASPDRGVDPRAFRNACGQFATGVTVITVRDGDGARGMTANSFTSVSLDPPLVLVSVDLKNRTHTLLGPDSRFVVNILADDHVGWSDRFAGRHGDIQHQFEDVPHTLTEDGLPIIDGVLTALVCRVDAIHPAGDHSLFVGRVEQFHSRTDRAPLLFYGGSYRALAPKE
ncbi:MAG: flavin reductase family protein [Chloroflexota bacterium]